MIAYSYDKNYDPPVPVAEIVVSPKNEKNGTYEGPSIKVRMLIDTGADISFIPKSAIKELEKSGGNKLPYDMVEVEDFNGDRFNQKVYFLTLLPQPDGLGNGQTVMFLEFDEENGVLGRDVLNQYSICLDGKNLTWSIQS